MFEFGAKFILVSNLYLILALSFGVCEKGFAQSLSTAPVPFFPNSYSTKFTDAFSTSGNPASLAGINRFSAGMLAEQIFMLRGIKHYLLGMALPMARGGAGLLVNHLDAAGYSQSQAGFAYAKKLGDVDIGVKFNYHKVSVPGYGSSSTAVADIGSMWHVTDEMHAGIHVYNPLGGPLNYMYNFGLGYEVSEQVLVAVEFIKQEDKPSAINAGIYYQPAPQIILQTGITAVQPYGSISMQWNQLRLGMLVRCHSQLGMSPALSIIYVSPENATAK
jgi:hypothetical protein